MRINDKLTAVFNSEENHVIAKLFGDYDLDEALANFDHVVNCPMYKLGMNRIWDISKAIYKSHLNEEIETVAKYPVVFPPDITNVKDAIVSSSDHNWNILKEFRLHTQGLPNKVEFFERLQDAINWVRGH